MCDEDIQSVIKEMDNVRTIRLNEEGLPKGVWFVFEAGLLPLPNEINSIISDIINDGNVYLSYDGHISHSDSCKVDKHELEANIANSIENIKEQSFKIALWESSQNSKPHAICISSEISHFIYPNHPHINCGGLIEEGIYIPDSLCFFKTLDEIGQVYPDKIINSISQIRLWIFRHYIWLATGIKGKPVWIGMDVDTDESNQFLFYRNPLRKCWCGRDRFYIECHLISDCYSAMLNKKNPFNEKYFSKTGQFDLMLYCQRYKKINDGKIMAYEKLKNILDV